MSLTSLTAFSPEMPADKIESLIASGSALGRCAVPEDVARVVAFLVSEDAGWVTGRLSFHISWQQSTLYTNMVFKARL